MEKWQSKNLILLTGAGFTKNFNGFLGKEMWSKIFNSSAIQSTPNIANLLRENFDYEDVYSRVLRGGFSDIEKQTMQQVVEAVYKKLDDATRTWIFNDSNPTAFNIYGLNNDLMNLFQPANGQEKGFHFTLNQDLFMEREYRYRSPGAPFFPQDFYNFRSTEFQNNFFVTLLSDAIPEKVEKVIVDHNGLVYVKLHGSYGWRSSNGLNQMVIGKNKEEDIEREPLLKYYFELFQNVIKEGNKRLVIIGYGFKDQHINKILVDGVKNYGLKIYVISTASPESFRENFERGGHYYALPIMEGLCGYFPYSMREIFPADQSRSVHIDEIRERLLSKN